MTGEDKFNIFLSVVIIVSVFGIWGNWVEFLILTLALIAILIAFYLLMFKRTICKDKFLCCGREAQQMLRYIGTVFSLRKNTPQ